MAQLRVGPKISMGGPCHVYGLTGMPSSSLDVCMILWGSMFMKCGCFKMQLFLATFLLIIEGWDLLFILTFKNALGQCTFPPLSPFILTS